jgi:putative transposase
MPDYRRNFVPGGSHFFTVALVQRSSHLLTANIDLLRNAVHCVKREMPFELVAMVVLRKHLHCVWTLPEGDIDYPERWKKIKAMFSRGIPVTELRSSSRMAKADHGIWQRRYWEHTLRSEEDLNRHVDYIHFNPVKHRHVGRVNDWPYSSFHRYVWCGIYTEEWAGSGFDD